MILLLNTQRTDHRPDLHLTAAPLTSRRLSSVMHNLTSISALSFDLGVDAHRHVRNPTFTYDAEHSVR